MPEELKDEIETMLNAGSGVEEKPSEKVSEEEVDGEKVDEEEIVEEEEEKEEEVVDEDEKEEKFEEEKPSKEDDSKDELERIKGENEELRKKLDKSYEEKEIPSKEEPPKKPSVEEVNFLGEDIDLDELTRDKDVFNKLLNKVYKIGVEASRQTQEDTLKSIPDIVKSNVILQTNLKKKVDKFYTDNKDLAPFKKAVASVYEEISAENPDWEMDKVFEKTGEESRKRLELRKKVEEETSPSKPRFPKTKGTRVSKQKPDVSPLLEEIDKMNEVL